MGFGRSSGGVDSGDESAGDCAMRSSASDVWPLSRDAAKPTGNLRVGDKCIRRLSRGRGNRGNRSFSS